MNKSCRREDLRVLGFWRVVFSGGWCSGMMSAGVDTPPRFEKVAPSMGLEKGGVWWRMVVL